MTMNGILRNIQTSAAILMAATLVAGPTHSKVEEKRATRQIKVKVDGLSCPFCAYGLEKYLKKIKGVKKVTVYIDKGQAVIRLRDDAPFKVDAVRKAVKKGGFTPRQVTITAIGKIAEENQRWVFHPEKTEQIFLVAEGEALKKLQKSKLIGQNILVTGTVSSEHPNGHGDHPGVLRLQEYRVLNQ